jgi:hypothetical protein
VVRPVESEKDEKKAPSLDFFAFQMFVDMIRELELSCLVRP